MNISVIGTGYVGLVTGACFSWLGMNVMCMDIDKDKINKLSRGIVPIYEPGLEEIIRECWNDGRLHFTTSLKETVDFSEVIFITVGTPPKKDGSADLAYVFQAAEEIARHINKYTVIVDKSTVPVGTGRQVKELIKSILKENGRNIDFDVVSNPEFLREGSAVKDFIKPDRIIIGAANERAAELMKKVYQQQLLMDIPFIVTNLETAEMIKYACNSFLAVKISYINEIANMCDICNADVATVAKAMGLDDRIGPSFLNPGPGFGGSCFPKDTKAMITFGRNIGYVPEIIESAAFVNRRQSILMFEKIKKAVGKLSGKTITILGLAFKPGTDDIRESPSISIIKLLLKNNAQIKTYDPQAVNNTKTQYPDLDIEYCTDAYSACSQSDCIVLMTEWREFCSLDFEKLITIVSTPVFIDLRNVYDSGYVKNFGFSYEGVGKR